MQEHNISRLKVRNYISHLDARKLCISSPISVSSGALVPSAYPTSTYTAASLSYCQPPPLQLTRAAPAIFTPTVSPSPWFSLQNSFDTFVNGHSFSYPRVTEIFPVMLQGTMIRKHRLSNLFLINLLSPSLPLPHLAFLLLRYLPSFLLSCDNIYQELYLYL